MYHIDDDGNQRPTTLLVQLLECVAEYMRIAFEFGNQYTEVLPQARVLIASNLPRRYQPGQDGVCPISRRYISLDTNDIPSNQKIPVDKNSTGVLFSDL